MSRHRRRWEEPPSSSSYWEPGYGRSYSDGYDRGRYGPPREFRTRSSFNYWRDDPQRSDSRESSNEHWRGRDDRRHWDAEFSYSRRRRDFEPGRDRDDQESWRDSGQRHRHPSSRPRHSTYTPPYVPRPTFRAKSPTQSNSLPPKLAPPGPPRKASPPSLPRLAPPEPPRKISPTMTSEPLRPSPGYISLSREPSEILYDYTKTRKLLVLDLNGTLLIRSARRATSGTQLRPVQPRPYMQSFRQYLFSLQTKAWLDTMVWSSAQPHSVKDMVDKVFGTAKGELKATWNRKSMGLSEADYHRKTATTKDLEKAWDLFTSALCPKTTQRGSAVQSQSQIMHSALTTLLLDDSPHKAVLQPYSHVCIPEYDSTRRRHDLRSFLAKKEQSKKAKRKNQDELAIAPVDRTVPELFTACVPTELVDEEPYDVTLLAVIGILEAVKLQSNVAGWIRKGGLWAREENVTHVVVKTEGSGNDASSASDPTVAPGQDRLQTKMWFEDSSVVAFWVAQGRKALTELGILAVHGVTG